MPKGVNQKLKKLKLCTVTAIITFDDGSIHECEYEKTESYQVMELFINNREQLLKRLLGNSLD